MFRAILITALIVAGIFAITGNVLAKGGGGHGSGMSAANPDRGSHMSDSGQANTNAQFLPDSTRGLDRARQRMSEQGLAHEKAQPKDDQAETAKKPKKSDTLRP